MWPTIVDILNARTDLTGHSAEVSEIALPSEFKCFSRANCRNERISLMLGEFPLGINNYRKVFKELVFFP
jgi:hypothetical protein